LKQEGRVNLGIDRKTDLVTLARGGMLTLAGSIGSSVLGFLLVVVVTRGLHAGGGGVFFEAVALFMILSNTVELGADTALVRMVARYRALDRFQDVRGTLLVALVPVLAVGIILGAATFLLAPRIAEVFVDPRHLSEAVIYLRLFALFLPLASATTVSLAGTRGMGTMVPYVAIQNIGIPLARPLAVLLVLAFGWGSLAVGLAWAVPVAAGFGLALTSLVVLHRRLLRGDAATASPRSPRSLAGAFWRFAAPRGLATILQVTIFWVDILLLGALRSTPESGVYAAAARFVGVGTFALQGVAIAIAPQLSALLARDARAGAQELFQTATWWLMALSWPLYLTIAIFAPLFMSIFGTDFVQGQTALLILSLGLLALISTGNNKVVLLMAGGSGVNLAITTLALATNLVLNFLLIPRIGMEGAAIASAATIFVDNAATTAMVRLRLRLHPFGNGWGLVAASALVCYGAVGLAARAAWGATVPSLLVHGIVGTSLYLVVLWRLREVLHLSVIGRALRSRRVSGADWAVTPPGPPAGE
jgi:O-antigen/teichoic acid export membrane protein